MSFSFMAQINLHIIFFPDFSLSKWKTDNQIINIEMKASEIALLQEVLGIPEYLKDSCSRQAGNYFPHRNFWKDGNCLITFFLKYLDRFSYFSCLLKSHFLGVNYAFIIKENFACVSKFWFSVNIQDKNLLETYKYI